MKKPLLFPTTLFVFVGLVGFTVGVSTADAQDAPMEPKRYDNVDWHHVALVSFHAGKRERALELIKDYFEVATDRSGTDMPVVVELQTGQWDLLVIWTMEGGPADMTWEVHPDTPKWMAAMAEVAGGVDEAKKIGEEYQSLISRWDSFVGLSGRYGIPVKSR